jgi:hypothetical protein
MPNQKMKLFLDINYTVAGWMNVSMNAFDHSESAGDNFSGSFFIGNSVYVESFDKLYNNSLDAIIGFTIKNALLNQASNISWKINLGDSTRINSTTPITIGAQNKAYVFIDHNYTSHGTYNVSMNVTYAGSTDNKNYTITI